jgi:hypothetical protein
MSTQYDLAYKSPVNHPQNTSTTNTVPVTINVDTYGFADGVARDNYTVDFVETLRDVVSIELVHASIPTIADNAADRYIILRVNDYSKVKSNNNRTRNSFCIIPLNGTAHSVTRSSTPDDSYIYYFPTPTRLSNITIRLARPSSDTALGAMNNNHHVLTFEVRTLNRVPKPENKYQGNINGPWTGNMGPH